MKAERTIRRELKKIKAYRKGGSEWIAIVQTLDWVLDEQDGCFESPSGYMNIKTRSESR